jgi:hypothetical protein
MAACCCSIASLAGMREADEGRPIHSPKVLASENRVAKIRIHNGNGSLTFFINPYLPAKGAFRLSVSGDVKSPLHQMAM